MKNKSPRAKFIQDVATGKIDVVKFAGYVWDCMQLASTHDPDHAQELKKLNNLIYAEVKLQDRRSIDIYKRLSALERGKK